MAIRKSRKNEKIIINLNGPQGNAYYLMGVVQSTFTKSGARELGQSIVKQMMEGDYENLIRLFDLYLGNHFDLVRD